MSLLSQVFGLLIEGVTGGAGRALSAAGTWQGYSFVPDKNRTLSGFAIWQSSKTGAPAPGDITFELQTDSGSGTPSGTVLETRSPASLPAGGGRLDVTGFTYAATAGTPLWLVVKNLNAAPATHNIAPLYFASANLTGGIYSNTALRAWGSVATTNGGGTWATNPQARAGGLLVRYADGTNTGVPYNFIPALNTLSVGTYGIYGNRAHGVRFGGIPTGLTANVVAVSTSIRKASNPADACCEIYNAAGTLLGSATVPASMVTTGTNGNVCRFDFAAPVGLEGSQGPFRIVIRQVGGGGNSSNYYFIPQAQVFDTSAEVASTAPMGGTWVYTSTSDYTLGPSGYAETGTLWTPMVVTLDPVTPYSAASGGGAPRIGSRLGVTTL